MVDANLAFPYDFVGAEKPQESSLSTRAEGVLPDHMKSWRVVNAERDTLERLSEPQLLHHVISRNRLPLSWLMLPREVLPPRLIWASSASVVDWAGSAATDAV